MRSQNETINSDCEYNISTKNGRENSISRANYITFPSRNTTISLTVGIIAGLLFSQICIFSLQKFSIYFQLDDISIYHRYEEDRASNGIKKIVGSDFYYNENRTIADQLFNEIRILCWVMTTPENHETYEQSVKETWGQRCNKLIFMSSKQDEKLEAVEFPGYERRPNLWGKTKKAFKNIYHHHLDKYDWFLKTDDDTYVVMENLRKLLFAYSGEYPLCVGCKLETASEQEDLPAGKRYVLNRKAVKRFVENALHDRNKCRQESDGEEEIELAKCLRNYQVLAGDFPKSIKIQPTDSYGHFEADVPNTDVSSDNTIFVYSQEPAHMYILEYLIYHLRPLGVIPVPDILPDKISVAEIMIDTTNNNNKSNVLAY